MHQSDGLWERWKIEPLGLRELVEQSDAVCVLLNYFTRYQGLLGERFLPHCKPDQVLVSLGAFEPVRRGGAGRGAGHPAAWPRPGSTAWSRACSTPAGRCTRVRNLQVTPRVAGTTRESRIRSAWAVVRRIDEILSEAPAPRAEFRPTTEDDSLDLEAGQASA